MIAYFVHSTSTDNEKHALSGWSNPSLSEKGREQAKRLKDRLADTHFDFVYASDLNRAQETAHTAFPNASIINDARLREMNFGELNGVVNHLFPQDPIACINTPFINGECCLDVEQRMRLFLTDIPDLSANIAIVAHKYPQLALDVICKDFSWEQAIENDWRQTGRWQAGWHYHYSPITP